MLKQYKQKKEVNTMENNTQQRNNERLSNFQQKNGGFIVNPEELVYGRASHSDTLFKGGPDNMYTLVHPISLMKGAYERTQEARINKKTIILEKNLKRYSGEEKVLNDYLTTQGDGGHSPWHRVTKNQVFFNKVEFRYISLKLVEKLESGILTEQEKEDIGIFEKLREGLKSSDLSMATKLEILGMINNKNNTVRDRKVLADMILSDNFRDLEKEQDEMLKNHILFLEHIGSEEYITNLEMGLKDGIDKKEAARTMQFLTSMNGSLKYLMREEATKDYEETEDNIKTEIRQNIDFILEKETKEEDEVKRFRRMIENSPLVRAVSQEFNIPVKDEDGQETIKQVLNYILGENDEAKQEEAKIRALRVLKHYGLYHIMKDGAAYTKEISGVLGYILSKGRMTGYDKESREDGYTSVAPNSGSRWIPNVLKQEFFPEQQEPRTAKEDSKIGELDFTEVTLKTKEKVDSMNNRDVPFAGLVLKDGEIVDETKKLVNKLRLNVFASNSGMINSIIEQDEKKVRDTLIGNIKSPTNSTSLLMDAIYLYLVAEKLGKVKRLSSHIQLIKQKIDDLYYWRSTSITKESKKEYAEAFRYFNEVVEKGEKNLEIVDYTKGIFEKAIVKKIKNYNLDPEKYMDKNGCFDFKRISIDIKKDEQGKEDILSIMMSGELNDNNLNVYKSQFIKSSAKEKDLLQKRVKIQFLLNGVEEDELKEGEVSLEDGVLEEDKEIGKDIMFVLSAIPVGSKRKFIRESAQKTVTEEEIIESLYFSNPEEIIKTLKEKGLDKTKEKEKGNREGNEKAEKVKKEKPEVKKQKTRGPKI
jgi:hypothetical protein